MQNEIGEREQELSDLCAQSNPLIETAQDPVKADNLCMQLVSLQHDIQHFKHETTDKHAHLQEALHESQRKKRELEEYRQSVENLSKWIEDTKKIADAGPVAAEASAKLTEQHKVLQQVNTSTLHYHVLLWTVFT